MDNKGNGQGTHTYDDGGVYEGEWKDGLRHGQGTHTYANGNVYEGEWKAGKRNGYGAYTSDHEDMQYVGGWKDGKEDGHGIKIFGEAYDADATGKRCHRCDLCRCVRWVEPILFW